jgi:hypothetical protein
MPSQPSRPDGWPPPVTEAPPVDLAATQSFDDMTLKQLRKRLIGWVALFSAVATILGTGSGYIFAAGQKVTETPSKTYVDEAVKAVSAADVLVHKDADAHFRQIDLRLERLTTVIEGQTDAIKELKAELKEERLRPRNPRER